MEEFIRATTTPTGDIFTYRCSRLLHKNSFRDGPNMIEDFETVKRLNDLKPGRLDPESDTMKSTDNNPNQALVIYLWTLTENFSINYIDLDFIKTMVQGGASMSSVDKHGQTILHALVRDWHPDTVRFAEEQCIDLDAQDNFGVSALHLAAGMNLKETSEELLRHGANPNIDTFGDKQTPVHYAAKYNSVEALKVLIKFKGDINKLDEMKRTPLFVAAEYGSAQAVQYLMDIGAPVSVTNCFGISAMSFIAEKMPVVAYNALSQFLQVDTTKNEKKWFIYNLENYENRGSMLEKSVIELIAIYDQFELASHPVVQKAIEVKWLLYGKKHTCTRLVMTLLHLILWLVLAYEFQDNHDYYTPLKTNGWKIPVEVLIVLSGGFFFGEEMKKRQKISADHQRWVASKEMLLTKNLKHCHPTWPSERKYLNAEFKRVKNAPSLKVSSRVWYIYELLYMLIIVIVVITRIVDLQFKDNPEDRAKIPHHQNFWGRYTKMTPLSENLFLTHKIMFSLGLLFSFFRVCKFLCAFRAMGVFLRLSALSIESFVQFLLLFLQLFIPLLAAHWAMFGGNDDNVELIARRMIANDAHLYNETGFTYKNISGIMTHSLNEEVQFYLVSLPQVAYTLWEQTVNHNELLWAWLVLEPGIIHVLFAISSFLLTFVGFNIFTALVVFTFKTKYSRCTSLATISQATKMLHLEHGADPVTLKHIKMMHKQHCNPLIETLHHSDDIESEEKSLVYDISRSQRQMQRMFDRIKEAEIRYQKKLQMNCDETLKRLKVRMDVLRKRHSELKTDMKKDLQDIVTGQENLIRHLPKLLEKGRKAQQPNK